MFPEFPALQILLEFDVFSYQLCLLGLHLLLNINVYWVTLYNKVH